MDKPDPNPPRARLDRGIVWSAVALVGVIILAGIIYGANKYAAPSHPPKATTGTATPQPK
jgi:hypothetical protein